MKREYRALTNAYQNLAGLIEAQQRAAHTAASFERNARRWDALLADARAAVVVEIDRQLDWADHAVDAARGKVADLEANIAHENLVAKRAALRVRELDGEIARARSLAVSELDKAIEAICTELDIASAAKKIRPILLDVFAAWTLVNDRGLDTLNTVPPRWEMVLETAFPWPIDTEIAGRADALRERFGLPKFEDFEGLLPCETPIYATKLGGPGDD